MAAPPSTWPRKNARGSPSPVHPAGRPSVPSDSAVPISIRFWKSTGRPTARPTGTATFRSCHFPGVIRQTWRERFPASAQSSPGKLCGRRPLPCAPILTHRPPAAWCWCWNGTEAVFHRSVPMPAPCCARVPQLTGTPRTAPILPPDRLPANSACSSPAKAPSIPACCATWPAVSPRCWPRSPPQRRASLMKTELA